MYACLLELRVGDVSGFDLSALNAYWWYPGAERLQLGRMPHRRLSAAFPLHTLDLQARLDAALARQRQAAEPSDGSSSQSGDENEDGLPEGGGSSAGQAAWEHDAILEVPVTADGQWNAVAVWFEACAGPGGDARVSSWGDAPAVGASSSAEGAGKASEAEAASPAPAASSWDQAVHYVDCQAVSAGSTVQLRVRQDAGQLLLTTHPVAQCRPRHALGELRRTPSCYPGGAACGWPAR